jgi:F-type H+-transporting ATPase subunit b
VRTAVQALVLAALTLTAGGNLALAEPALAAQVLDGGALDSGALDSGLPGGLDSEPAIAVAHQLAPAGHEAHGTQGVVAAAHGTDHGEHGEAEHGSQHGEHKGFRTGTFLLQLLNLGVLLFLLIFFGGKAMNKALRARHEQLKGDVADAARLHAKAKQDFEAQERRLAALEKELADLRASIRQDARREQARMVEGAQERAKKIQEDMRLEIDQQVKEAEMLLRAEVATASVKLAAELARKAVDPLDQRRLAQEFVAGFDTGAPSNEGGG